MTDRFSETEWLVGGLKMLADGGVAAVRIEPLARMLGVTKGSFYWHFVDRAQFLDRLILEWERIFTVEPIDRAEAMGGDAETRLLHVIGEAMERDGPHEMSVRAWAMTDSRIMEVVKRVDARRIEYLESLLRAIGLPEPAVFARARMLYFTHIGEICVGASEPPEQRRAAALLNYRMIVTAP